MFDVLESILVTGGLVGMFELKQRDDRTSEVTPWVAYRVKPNIYKIRAFELWKTSPNTFFRIYHAPDISENLKMMLESLPNIKKVKNAYIDF